MERLENVRNLTSGMKYSSKLEVNQVRKLQFEFRTSNYECENNRLEALSESHRINITCNKEVPTNFLQDNLLEKYFLLWKKYCTNKQVPVINNNERIHKFVDSLKMYKENASMKKQSTETNKNDRAKSKDINFNTFEHRFKAQREVIETQKIKLIEQARIIETLKLGLIEDELEKSLSNAKNEIREIFQKCSVKVRCRTHILNENVPTMQVKSNSVPRIFRRMEKRAEERLLKRQIIIQRKMMLEEIKKKHTEEVMEKKKAADEEQRLKNLHDVEDKRLKEIELEKLKKAKREIYLKKLHKAVLYYNKKLKHLGFISLRNMLYVKKKNEELSNIFYNSGMQRKCIRKWNLYVKSEMQEKYLRADAFYKLKCLKPAILSFKFVSTTNIFTIKRENRLILF